MKKLLEKLNANVYLTAAITLFEIYTMITLFLKAESFLIFIKTYDWTRHITVIVLCILVIRISLQMDTCLRKTRLMQLVARVRLWRMFNQDIDYSSPQEKMQDFKPELEAEKKAVKKIWHSKHNHVDKQQLEKDLDEIYN